MMFHLIKKLNIYFFTIAIFISVSPWLAYALNINVGLSSLIDEGNILLLMNDPKPLGPGGTQFHIIVGALITKFSYSAETLLWTRYILQLVSTLILLISSIIYLRMTTNIKNLLYIYVILFLFLSSICLYSFTKAVSYNHFLQFTVSLTISFYLMFNTFANKVIQCLCLFLIGFIGIFAILNILPSGILLLFSTVLILILQVYSSYRRIFYTIFFILSGALFASLIVHLYIKNASELYQEYYKVSASISNLGRSYDVPSLLFSLSRSILTFVVIGTLSLGLHTLFESLKYKFTNPYLPYIITCIFLVVLYVYSLKYTHKASLGLSEWSMSPLLLALFYYYKKDSLTWPLNTKNYTIIFLSILPIIASLGTNLGIASKFFYFIGTWIIVIFLLSDKIETASFNLILLISLVIGFIGHVSIIGLIVNSTTENSVKSSKLSRISSIYITPKQKNHFENLHDTLMNHGFVDGDTILAFQPDLMSVFAVGATAGRQVYFVPSDFLANDIHVHKQPRFIILNEYTYSQVNEKLKYWGFPETYSKINIGTPETENYFNADKPRMLFCLK